MPFVTSSVSGLDALKVYWEKYLSLTIFTSNVTSRFPSTILICKKVAIENVLVISNPTNTQAHKQGASQSCKPLLHPHITFTNRVNVFRVDAISKKEGDLISKFLTSSLWNIGTLGTFKIFPDHESN